MAVEALTLTVPWVVFMATIQGDFERAPAYLPFPAVVIALLVWLYRKVAGPSAA